LNLWFFVIFEVQTDEAKGTTVAETEVQAAPARRTQRVQISMPVLVHGRDFNEATNTVAVNAHGCLVLLKAKVVRDDQVSLINPKTAEELPAKVVSLGKPEDGKIPVGVEFGEPSPLFWRINFPPEDWFTSSERKRPASSARPVASTPVPAKK
jgi:hypothetical protein